MKIAFALAFWSAPLLALGCPVCARDNAPWAALLIAGMLAVPYAVSAVVIRAIRDAEGRDRS
jgi:hypothetical protein